MYNGPTSAPVRPRTRLGRKIGLVAAGLAAGAIGATAVSAAAQSTPSAPSSSSTAPAAPSGAPAAGHGGAAPVRSDEHALSASQTATITAAALKAVPGGTVYRVETDAGDGSYEAHMTKADGSLVTVKLDKNLAVTKVEAGMGNGDPAPAGAH